MPLESAADFNSYVDINTGHGVTATFFEVQNNLYGIQRLGLIDTWYDIDSGNIYKYQYYYRSRIF